MDNDFKQIIEIEKECTEKIRAAELNSNERTSALEKELAEKKNKFLTEIRQENKQRIQQRINRAKNEIKHQLEKIKDRENVLRQDQDLCRSIRNSLIEILLGTDREDEATDVRQK